MKFVKDILCITVPELEGLGVKSKTIRMGCLRQRQGKVSCWAHTKVGKNVFIHYESLRKKYQEDIIYDLCGGLDPYEFVGNESLVKHLVLKAEDEEYIDGFIDAKGHHLSWDFQEKYKEAARYLYLLQRFSVVDKKKLGFKTAVQFNKAVIAMIKANKVKLPNVWARLSIKKAAYDRNGTAIIISGKHGASNSDKLTMIQKDCIVQLYSFHNQLSATQVKDFYNEECKKRGWKEISQSYVNQLVKQPDFRAVIEAQRYGMGTFRNNYDFIIKRQRPSRPNMLWVGDGTPYELYYQKTEYINGKKVVKHHLRKYIYVVIDAFNDVVMGYAIGNTENVELITAAWKNACVTNSVLPDQIVTDRFATKAMKPLYHKIALNKDFYTPAKVGNARSKVVEAFFGRMNKEVARLRDNFSGHNITAKNQPNRDFLNKNKKFFPDEDGVMLQIEDDIKIWNSKTRKNKTSLIEMWNNGDHSKDRTLSDKKRLQVFGIKHNHFNRLTNEGLTPTLLGEVRYYAEDSIKFNKSVGCKYQVFYDDEDLSKILAVGVNDEFLLAESVKMKMALGDFEEGDGKRLNDMLKSKDKFIEHIEHEAIERIERLESIGLSKGAFLTDGSNKYALNSEKDHHKRLGKEDEAKFSEAFDDRADYNPIKQK